MSSSDTWLRVVRRRLCGHRSPEWWQEEAERATERRRQLIAERAADVQAARELLALLECPTPADLRREEAERARRELLEDGDEAESVESIEQASGTHAVSVAPTELPLPSPSTPSVPPSLTPVQRFDELLAEEVTAIKLQAHPDQFYPDADVVHSALRTAMFDHSTELIFSYKSEDAEVFDCFRRFDERLHLAAAMNELERRMREEFVEAEVVHGRNDGQGVFWGDWAGHIAAQAVRECDRLGVRVIDWSGGDTTELLLTKAEHFDRVLALIAQLGWQNDMRPFVEDEGCSVCEWRTQVERDAPPQPV